MEGKVFQVDRGMLVFGMRYAIGRMTSAPSIAIENIKHNIDKLNVNELKMLIRDIESHIGGYGMACDELDWMNFKKYLQNRVNEDNLGS